MNEHSSFGRWVKRCRIAHDLTQEALAEQVGCTSQTIRKIESGARRPSRQIAERLATLLKLPPEQREAFLKAARAPHIAADTPTRPIAHATQRMPGTPAYAPPDWPRGTVTLLFTDIEGSTRLWEHYPHAMPRALGRHDAILRESIAAHGGVVFHTVGDAFCAAFAAAPPALAAAAAAQRALHAEPWGATGPLRVRTALHTDVVELRDGDYYGLPLSRVARILSAGHGGQILLSRATHDLVADHLPPGETLRDLGEHHLRDLSRPEQIFQLAADDLPAEFPPLATLDAHHIRLPVAPTPFVGREAERAELARRITDPACRLLTVLAPGGMGKTRLAVQVAADNAPRFSHGVYFVPLAASAPEAIVPAIADALRIAFYGPEDARAQLLAYLREKELLLVLDNFEQLLAGAGLLVDILTHAPEVKLLITSRERLNLQEEWVFALEGLTFPRSERAGSLADYSAVELFVQRARQAQAGFALTPAEQPYVAQICRLVEGMPLGIELAASWARVLSCAEIAQEIQRSTDFLTTLLRDVPERHRSMRAVFEHSWNLLSEPERRVLRKLSVFRGGFARAAAERVAGAGLPLLAALVDKSLLRRSTSGRYDMHELVRQYAAAQLQDDPEDLAATRDRHCDYYMTLLQERELPLKSPRQQEIVAELSAEIDNLRLAWDWAIARRKIDAIRRALQTLFWFYEFRSWFQEGRAVFGRAAAALHGTGGGLERDIPLGQLLTSQGYFFSRCGQIAQSRDLLQESIALLSRSGDQAALSDALMWRGVVAYQVGDYAEARRRLRESLAINRSLDDPADTALCLTFLGMVAHALGEYRGAHDLFREALAIWRTLGDPRGIALCLTFFSVTLYALGSYAEAQELLRESLALNTATGDRWSFGTALNHLGQIVQTQGEHQEAYYLFRECLALFKEIGTHWGIGGSFNNLGAVAADMGRYAEAIQLCKESLAICRETGYRRGAALALSELGRASCALGDYAAARIYFREALETALELQATPVALDVLVGLAALLAQEGAPERAAELLSLVLRHPASARPTQDRAERLRADLARGAPALPFDFARELPAAPAFEDIVQGFLGAPRAKQQRALAA